MAVPQHAEPLRVRGWFLYRRRRSWWFHGRPGRLARQIGRAAILQCGTTVWMEEFGRRIGARGLLAAAEEEAGWVKGATPLQVSVAPSGSNA